MTFPDQFGKDGGRTGGVLGQFGEKLNPNLTEPKINLAKLQRETRSTLPNNSLIIPDSASSRLDRG